MTKLIISLIILCATPLLSQQLICPENRTQFCYEAIDGELPQIIDGAGLELLTEKEFIGDNCQVSRVRTTFRLVDEAGETVSSCVQELIVQPLQETVLFPRDTVVYGVNLADVVDQSVYTAGIFPLGTNECNIRYTFADVVVESYPELYVFRNWAAENFCTGEITAARQRISLLDLPNNSITTNVADCGGNRISIDSIQIRRNGQLIDRAFCFRPFQSLHELLNCMSDSLLQNDTDVLTLDLLDIRNPYIGLSTIDLIDIRRHILGLKRFDESCRLEAADVNRDGLINGIDLVELRRLVLGIYTAWPFGEGPHIYVNGSRRDKLEFQKADFPLEQLEIIVVNQGNTSTN